MPDIQQYIIQIIDRLSKPIEGHSIQFFSNSNPGDPNHKPKPLGSGVLLKYGKNHYITTAAHVLAELGQTHIGVYTRVKDFFEVISSSMIESSDIAVWKVEPDHAVDIAPEDWWYPIEKSIFNHNEVSEEKYFIYGFPAKKYKIDPQSKAIIQYPLRYFTRGYSSSPHARNANYDPNINLLMEFHKNKIRDIKTGIKETAPDPYGMSGCGLWFLDEHGFRLAGIMTEWKQPKEHIPALMGTRIDEVFKLI